MVSWPPIDSPPGSTATTHALNYTNQSGTADGLVNQCRASLEIFPVTLGRPYFCLQDGDTGSDRSRGLRLPDRREPEISGCSVQNDRDARGTCGRYPSGGAIAEIQQTCLAALCPFITRPGPSSHAQLRVIMADIVAAVQAILLMARGEIAHRPSSLRLPDRRSANGTLPSIS